MRSWGFAEEDFNPQVDLWPENWKSWTLFAEMFGQWRAGMGGKYAMDYTPLFMRMERMRLPDGEWEVIYTDIRVLESAALEQMRAND